MRSPRLPRPALRLPRPQTTPFLPRQGTARARRRAASYPPSQNRPHRPRGPLAAKEKQTAAASRSGKRRPRAGLPVCVGFQSPSARAAS